jgi:hypothetical protein
MTRLRGIPQNSPSCRDESNRAKAPFFSNALVEKTRRCRPREFNSAASGNHLDALATKAATMMIAIILASSMTRLAFNWVPNGADI